MEIVKESWNTDELRKLVLAKYGEDIYQKIDLSLDSIDKRQKYAFYHFHTYKTLLKEINLEADVVTSTKNLMIMGKKEQVTFIEIQANILASLHNMHSVFDTLGYILKYTFNLDFKDESRINISSVKKRLEYFEQYQKLVELLNVLISHDGFKYLNAIVNHSKHRSIIQPKYSIKFEDEWCGVEFQSFIYNNVNYEIKKVDEFMVTEYNRDSHLIVSIGQMINILVSQELTKGI